ncbi:hypothetical protein SELMODRAFT_438000 [Selaginella moellendorffii]|uniref:CCT domain-containing protein n=1 Tax=Selaginella moellendorffii TaxID=88036 RepID=D8QSN1_SELML|nr:zinc finger protein CONSTANS-LIKE 6 [Selaginella moellendorffii]EFJ36969.1 hypothetical protein SELMODRAFT_438000 [Selaginella moellendorffii]|eukprot:XP_002961709.1 zinc finger protein CONSTANS-LIKE 6 [Selaginella moellendorffii]
MEKASSTSKSSSNLAATAMAIAGRALRPCDVCGRERAKWFCKADEAYLCENCDGSVHGANAVSLRHERFRMGPNGMLMKNVKRVSKFQLAEDISPTNSAAAVTAACAKDSHCPPRKKPRSSRSHSLGSNSSKESGKVKAEPKSPKEYAAEFQPCQESSHEVPIFDPLLEDFAASDDNSLGCTVPCATPPDEDDEEMCFTVPDDCDLDGFLDSEADLGVMDGIISGTIEMDGIADLGDVLGESECKTFTHDSFGIDFPAIFHSPSPNSDGSVADAFDSADAVKVKTEEAEELDKIKLEVDEMLGFAFSSASTVKEEEVEKKITLKLDYEDVLNAWSDRGPFWTEGPRPQTVPDDSLFDPASTLDYGLVPDFCMESTEVEAVGQVPVVNFGEDRLTPQGGREARVMRYREKRRTRLFSKKIRYEVRKLNAERRPRLKGRFVKRTNSTPHA